MRDKVLLKVLVYPDRMDEARSRTRCSIARRILESDSDIRNIDVRANIPGKADTIAFSRQSTGLRYYFYMPIPGSFYIETFDKGEMPHVFMLVLHRSQLIKTTYSGLGWGWITSGTIDPGSQPDRADRRFRPVPA